MARRGSGYSSASVDLRRACVHRRGLGPRESECARAWIAHRPRGHPTIRVQVASVFSMHTHVPALTASRGWLLYLDDGTVASVGTQPTTLRRTVCNRRTDTTNTHTTHSQPKRLYMTEPFPRFDSPPCIGAAAQRVTPEVSARANRARSMQWRRRIYLRRSYARRTSGAAPGQICRCLRSSLKACTLAIYQSTPRLPFPC